MSPWQELASSNTTETIAYPFPVCFSTSAKWFRERTGRPCLLALDTHGGWCSVRRAARTRAEIAMDRLRARFCRSAVERGIILGGDNDD